MTVPLIVSISAKNILGLDIPSHMDYPYDAFGMVLRVSNFKFIHDLACSWVKEHFNQRKNFL